MAPDKHPPPKRYDHPGEARSLPGPRGGATAERPGRERSTGGHSFHKAVLLLAVGRGVTWSQQRALSSPGAQGGGAFGFKATHAKRLRVPVTGRRQPGQRALGVGFGAGQGGPLLDFMPLNDLAGLQGGFGFPVAFAQLVLASVQP